jgi:SNF2 family DNA or RNA helicase
MVDLIERKIGHNNEAMLEYCNALKDILMQTKEVKSGRGKSVEIRRVLKYKDDIESLNRIIKSCEHYKKLYDMESKFPFREYQKDIITKGSEILKMYKFLYLAMEVRTGKTLTSLGIAEQIGVANVLFITKKKAIGSIEADYSALSPSYSLTVINYESLHLVMSNKKWDLIICDEAHSMGAFPKPSQRAGLVAKVIGWCKPMVILLSGTPTPESYSQMYHQVYGIPNNPFREFTNFYRFCDKYVKVKDKKINGLLIRDYSEGLESIIKAMEPYTINYTQAEAGFKAETTEEVLEVEMSDVTYNLIKKLKRDLVIEGKGQTILAETPVKLMIKVHQLCSGTVKFESGDSMVIDLSKAEFIKKRFEGCKIGIFYKFKEEFNALRQVFRDENLTTDLNEFDITDKSIALQIVSGREGISLRNAKYLVYYNIDFSATSYWQSKDRMTTKDRLENQVYWIFSKGGIEKDIYKAVTKKKDYTISHFKNDFYIN